MKKVDLYNEIVYLFSLSNIPKSDCDYLFKQFNIETYIDRDKLLSDALIKKVRKIASIRVKSKKPLNLIFKKAYFYGREFSTKLNVLKPRTDTEFACFEAIKLVTSKSRVLDLCCGSGIIGITIMLETNASVVCSDISPACLKLTKKNAKDLIANLQVVKSDMFKNISGKYDLIISNPPYIESDGINTLSSEVKFFDPRLALDGGDDGLNFYRIIKNEFLKYLNKNGSLILEIGYNQGKKVKKLFDKFETTIIKDFDNNDRVAIIKSKP